MLQDTASQASIDDLNREARRLYDSSDYLSALRLAEQALQHSRAISYEPGIAAALWVCGNSQFFRTEYAAARVCGEEALALYAALGDATGQAQMLNLLGIICRETTDLTTALEYHQRQLEISLAAADLESQAQAHNSIAGVFYYMDDVLQAISYTEKALALYERSRNQRRQALTLSNLLELYAESDQVERGLQMAEALEALLMHADASASLTDHGIFFSRAARLHLANGDVERAAEYVQRGLALAEARGIKRLQAMLLEQSSTIAQRRGQLLAALRDAERAVALGEQHGFGDWMHTSLHDLATLWEQMGDFQRAYAYHQRFHEARFRVLNAEKDGRLRRIEARYQAERAQREAQFYRQEAERIEAQRTQEQQSHERLSRLKDELLASTTHDLKNPLASIKIAVSMLQRHLGADAARVSRYLYNIDQQADRIGVLIGGVLDLAKLESGLSLTPEPCSVTQLIESAVQDLALQAADKGVSLTRAEIAPDLRVLCNQDRVRQALANLIGNAIKYTPCGGCVTLEAIAGDQEAAIFVRDEGLGIPEDALPFIFDPFYRVPSVEHQAQEGTGLGLAIVRAIVQKHGGSLSVDSRPGGGSVFSFTLPLARETPGDAPPPSARTELR